MYLKYLQIKNFKNMASARFEFGKGANTIIGENDAGKSNAMTALRILLDSNYYYSSRQLKESDFSDVLGDWRGHWIIISAFFDEISADDRSSEIVTDLLPETENRLFLRSYIRCAGYDYGTVTLFIRPRREIRKALAAASGEEFQRIRRGITLADYEFSYTARAQTDFTAPARYAEIVGDPDRGTYADPDTADASLTGAPVNIINVWEHICFTFIDALRDVAAELARPKNPIKRIFDVVRDDLADASIQQIREKIQALNRTISASSQVADIGSKLNTKLQDIVGLVYSPEIVVESRLREDIASITRHLSVSPRDQEDIEQLGLGHLNILYIAMKLVEFEYERSHQIMNIMVIEEPEAHIHPHIQKALFDNLNVSGDYTQVIMTTHATHLSEVSSIRSVNIIKPNHGTSLVMRPVNGLDEFGRTHLEGKKVSMTTVLERYLDAKRSVLLFSKGVVLVEGDGEEILIPALVRSALGISLDEIGIGLINVGSVSFENIACMFAPERVRRCCAIVTDFDVRVDGAKHCSKAAEDRGRSRKKKLQEMFAGNPWVRDYYAPHTLEVDFANEPRNRRYIAALINDYYDSAATAQKHTSALSGSESDRYTAVMTVAKHVSKGWYATILASLLDHEVIIPDYLVGALAFASQEVVTGSILRKMAINLLRHYGNGTPQDALRREFTAAATPEQIDTAISHFCALMDENSFTSFIRHRKDLGLHG